VLRSVTWTGWLAFTVTLAGVNLNSFPSTVTSWGPLGLPAARRRQPESRPRLARAKLSRRSLRRVGHHPTQTVRSMATPSPARLDGRGAGPRSTEPATSPSTMLDCVARGKLARLPSPTRLHFRLGETDQTWPADPYQESPALLVQSVMESLLEITVLRSAGRAAVRLRHGVPALVIRDEPEHTGGVRGGAYAAKPDHPVPALPSGSPRPCVRGAQG
jgi:hypothetical protein